MDPLVRRFIFSVLVLVFPLATRAQQYVVDTLAANPNIAYPVSIAFSPDNSGKFFFTEKNNGRVRIFDQGLLRSTPFTTVSVNGSGEQGLLGVTFHPDYPDSPFVYILYTRSSDRWNIVARYRDSANVGVQPVAILLNPHTASNHNGGNIHFGPDRKLYVTLGDNASAANSQDSTATNLHGKILRLNFDGTIPSDNPWPGRPFWSIGHRNSFDFTFDPMTGRMYSSENGPSCDDEVNRVPRKGNLGWPVEGNCAYSNNPAYLRPLYYFTSPLPALTGITVYRAAAFPRLRGRILFTGNSSPNVWTLTLTANGDTIVPNSFSTFFTYTTGFADIEVGPDGFLYLTNGPYSSNRILRLRPVAPMFTSAPVLAATQDVAYVYTPTFSGTGPELQLVLAPPGMDVDTTTWTVRWTPTNQQALQRTHNITLRAENGAGFVDQAYTITVANVNDPPAPFALVSPPSDTTLHFVGNDPTVHFSWEAATDPDFDTLLYTLQTDTVITFNSPALRDTLTGTATSKLLTFSRRNSTYYWRVKATDGQFSSFSSEYRRVVVTFVTPVKDGSDEPVKESKLEQNFPNPFNPVTIITYTIPRSGPVRLAVYNLLGQEVALIYEGTQVAGTHVVEFTNSGLPSGIYFYRIQAADFVETKKLTILR